MPEDRISKEILIRGRYTLNKGSLAGHEIWARKKTSWIDMLLTALHCAHLSQVAGQTDDDGRALADSTNTASRRLDARNELIIMSSL